MTESVLKSRQEKKENLKTQKKLERDLEEELMDDYSLDLNKNKDLENDEWKYDKIPQFWNGFNVADFVDPDIMTVIQCISLVVHFLFRVI